MRGKPKPGADKVRVAFLTMVWRDYWLLERWVAHNATFVPKSQLYVIRHGEDPEIDRIAEGCNIIHAPRDGVALDLTKRRWGLISGIANGLQSFYDFVVCTDVDELLLHVGPHPGGLLGYLETAPRTGAALAPIGFELMPVAGDLEDMKLPVLRRCPNALLNGKFCKPCLTHDSVNYSVGGHGLIKGRFDVADQVLLLHLRYVVPNLEERMASRREIVQEARARNKSGETNIDESKVVWHNWGKPQRIKDKKFSDFERAADTDVSRGFDHFAELVRGALQRKGRTAMVGDIAPDGRPVRISFPEMYRDLV